jgi:hypothetical protein
MAHIAVKEWVALSLIKKYYFVLTINKKMFRYLTKVTQAQFVTIYI